MPYGSRACIKTKGSKGAKKPRRSLNTLSGFRFFDPFLADDDADDDDDGTDAEQSDGNNKMGTGSIARARVEKASISSSAKTSAYEKRRPGATSYSLAFSTCEKGSDTTSYSVAISACEKGQNSVASSTCEKSSDTTSYNAEISPCEKGSDTTSYSAAISACEKGQNTTANLASGSPMTATIKTRPCILEQAGPGILSNTLSKASPGAFRSWDRASKNDNGVNHPIASKKPRRGSSLQ